MTELAGAGTSNCSYMPNVHGSIGFALPEPKPGSPLSTIQASPCPTARQAS